jgi:hypothetical protein
MLKKAVLFLALCLTALISPWAGAQGVADRTKLAIR